MFPQEWFALRTLSSSTSLVLNTLWETVLFHMLLFNAPTMLNPNPTVYSWIIKYPPLYGQSKLTCLDLDTIRMPDLEMSDCHLTYSPQSSTIYHSVVTQHQHVWTLMRLVCLAQWWAIPSWPCSNILQNQTASWVGFWRKCWDYFHHGIQTEICIVDDMFAWLDNSDRQLVSGNPVPISYIQPDNFPNTILKDLWLVLLGF